MNPKILLVDDEPGTRFGFSKYLSKFKYDMQAVPTLIEAKKQISSKQYDAILLDLKLPDGNGLEWIPDLREEYPNLAIVVITGHGDVPLAVEAMRRGADHFLVKPVDLSELEIFLRKSLEIGVLRKDHQTRERLKKEFRPYFGESPAIKDVLELATIAADNDSTILLQGETGTGKGILARWIHEHSNRASNPFVEINCTSLKGELLASELFGHARGAFTSAVKDKQGLIEVANRATLFLDEISDMDLSVQAQFLKVIEEKEFRRVGEVKIRKSEFRLICATNRDLKKEIEEVRFRNDLYFRINVFPIMLPPLRGRGEDIPGFIQYMLESHGARSTDLSPHVSLLLSNYSWPGNIREMRNVIERALLLAQGNPLSVDHFPGLCASDTSSDTSGTILKLDEVIESHIQSVVQRYGRDKKNAAEALGMTRTTLYRRLKEYKKNLNC